MVIFGNKKELNMLRLEVNRLKEELKEAKRANEQQCKQEKGKLIALEKQFKALEKLSKDFVNKIAELELSINNLADDGIGKTGQDLVMEYLYGPPKGDKK